MGCEERPLILIVQTRNQFRQDTQKIHGIRELSLPTGRPPADNTTAREFYGVSNGDPCNKNITPYDYSELSHNIHYGP